MDPVHTHLELPESALAPMPKTRSAVASSVALIRNPPGQHIHSDPRVQAFANAVMAVTGADSFGTYLGHDSPTPELCLDIFVPKTPRTLADAVAQFVMDHYDEYGLWYVIRRQQIWNPQVANYWRDMEDRGSDTANHFDHDHVSFMETGPPVPVPTPVPVPKPLPKEEDMASPYTLFNWGGAVWAWSGGDPLPLDNWGQVEPYLNQGAVTIGDLTDEQFSSIAPTWKGRHPAADKDQTRAMAAVRGEA